MNGGLLSAIKENPGELKQFAKILAMACMVWPLAFALQPKRTVKETIVLLRGDYSSEYENGDPRRWPPSE